MIEIFRHLASFGALASLPASELQRDRSALFGSILGTLDHLMSGGHFILTRVRTVHAGSIGNREIPGFLDSWFQDRGAA